jgi:hypothetical protein
MALLSFRGISTPSLPAQGEQRRFPYFNIQRDNPVFFGRFVALLRAFAALLAGGRNWPRVARNALQAPQIMGLSSSGASG